MLTFLRRRTYGELVASELAQARLDLLEANRGAEDARAILLSRQERVERLEGELEKWTLSTTSSHEQHGYSPIAGDSYIASPQTHPLTPYARE